MKMAMDDAAWFETQLLERFTRYTGIFTTSDRLSSTKPSTPGQWDLLNLLGSELKRLGLTDVDLDSRGYLLARIPAHASSSEAPTIAFLAHVDTAPDAPGQGVKALVHRDYRGEPIHLPGGPILDPKDNPLLLNYVGQTIITSDGTTLLGADDKAGVSELMTAIAFLMANREHPHGTLEFIFTTDEEIGRGTENFPFDKVKSKFAYTLDGGEEGTVENECYNAFAAEVTFSGISIHPGSARGKLVNAVSMAAAFLQLLPRNESPEATDGRFGCLWANDIRGGIEKTSVDIYIRDFDRDEVNRRLESLKLYAKAVEAAFPGGSVEVKSQVQYLNMKDKLDQYPEIMAYLHKAISNTGVEPATLSIRGGTDGARLTELGLPTPNIFTGGMNYHSRTEWAALPAMVRASRVVLELASLWAKHPTL